jgi:hypothetical protein
MDFLFMQKTGVGREWCLSSLAAYHGGRCFAYFDLFSKWVLFHAENSSRKGMMLILFRNMLWRMVFCLIWLFQILLEIIEFISFKLRLPFFSMLYAFDYLLFFVDIDLIHKITFIIVSSILNGTIESFLFSDKLKF